MLTNRKVLDRNVSRYVRARHSPPNYKEKQTSTCTYAPQPCSYDVTMKMIHRDVTMKMIHRDVSLDALVLFA